MFLFVSSAAWNHVNITAAILMSWFHSREQITFEDRSQSSFAYFVLSDVCPINSSLQLYRFRIAYFSNRSFQITHWSRFLHACSKSFHSINHWSTDLQSFVVYYCTGIAAVCRV
ncbi:hypothetical protein C8J56DRAFT_902898 [Mycena floridula]|nr:hypothetical protein C8J56DRAFT_902898 [Mycena floridula]